MPGQTTAQLAADAVTAALQWRAGQLPGQTAPHHDPGPRGRGPSMEGRAIARPNLMAAGPAAAERLPSMEGRAIARPNRVRHADLVVRRLPSMEGRAIARPNGVTNR